MGSYLPDLSRFEQCQCVATTAACSLTRRRVVYAKAQTCYSYSMIQPEVLVGGEWADWYRLTPVQRWLESEKLWQTYLALGGSLDPELDTQSPFFDARAPRPCPAHGRSSVRVLRHSRV